MTDTFQDISKNGPAAAASLFPPYLDLSWSQRQGCTNISQFTNLALELFFTGADRGHREIEPRSSP